MNIYHNHRNNSKKYGIPCIWKTHSPFGRPFPVKTLGNNTKLIVVCRNPKDCLLSLYMFVTATIHKWTKFNTLFVNFYNSFITGMMIYGSWFEFYKEYFNLYNDPNSIYCHFKYDNEFNKIPKTLNEQKLLFLYYEDLKNDLKTEIIKIAKFIGYYNDLGNNNSLSKDTIINNIVNNCQFNSMKQLNIKTNTYPVGFFRNGTVNDWQKYLTKDQSSLIDNLIRCTFYNTNFKYYKQLL